ncbi:MAG: cytochrome c peroxidase [Polaribacter sp.]|jgi:cytochrome c peroxidase
MVVYYRVRWYGIDEMTPEGISIAVSEFIQSITSFDSKYDQGVDNNFSNFSPLESLGKAVFFEKANCSGCHVDPLFSPSWGGASANIGLDLIYEDPGVSSTFTQVVTEDGQLIFVENPLGIINSGQFKIPSLRNIGLTAPYMHDGPFGTLEEVVEHYNSGIKNHPQLSWHFKSFDQTTGNVQPQRMNLTELEKEGLVAFLKTLSGESFRTDEKFSDPFLR